MTTLEPITLPTTWEYLCKNNILNDSCVLIEYKNKCRGGILKHAPEQDYPILTEIIIPCRPYDHNLELEITSAVGLIRILIPELEDDPKNYYYLLYIDQISWPEIVQGHRNDKIDNVLKIMHENRMKRIKAERDLWVSLPSDIIERLLKHSK